MQSKLLQCPKCYYESKAINFMPQIEHGTNAGYSQHIRRKTKACEDCKMARRIYQRSRAR